MAKSSATVAGASVGLSAAASGGRGGGVLRALRRPRVMAVCAAGLIAALAAAVIAPNIPQQMRRSGAFQAMADGDYETAALELETYTKERPNDAEAGLQYGLAALHIGELGAARAAFEKFSGVDMSGRDEFALGEALTRLDSPALALGLLDGLVARNSQNPSTYLIRGVLRAGQGDLRRARDDFLQADDLIRGYAEEDDFLPLAHKILLRAAARSAFSAPAAAPKAAAPVEGRVGFPLGAAGFANQYALPADGEFLREAPPQSAIPALYYANLLIRDGQYQEAESELRQASSLAPDLLLAANLEAFLLLQRGEFSAAAEKLAGVVDRAPNSPRALLNLANAQWSENPDPARWEAAAAAYDEIVSAPAGADDGGAAATALNNRGHIRALGGNLKGAREDFAAAGGLLGDAAADGGAAGLAALARRVRFNLAVVDLAEGNSAEVVDDLEELAEARFPGASRALVAAAEIALLPERAARYRPALTAGGDREPLLAAALHYERRGLLLRALWTLDQLPPSDELRDVAGFRRGRILAKLGNVDAARGQLEDIQDPRRAGVLRAVAAAARGESAEAVELYRGALAAVAAPPLPGELAEFVESLGEWLAPGWPAADDLAGLPVEFYPRLAALAARAQAAADPAEARRLAELAARVWPNDFMVLRHAGAALGELGDAAAGLSLLERAWDGYPADEDLLRAMQALRAETGDRDGALRAAETLFNLANAPGGEEEAAFHMAAVPKRLKNELQRSLSARDYDSALAVYDQALAAARSADARHGLLYHRAALLRASNRGREALVLLDELAEAENLDDRQRAAALAGRAQARLLEDDRRRAEEDFRAAAALDPARADYLRRAALAAERPEDGLEEVIRRFPRDAPAYWDLAEMYRNEGQFDRVIRVLRRLARVRPSQADIYKTLGEIQATAGYSRDAAVNKQIYNALTGAQ